jgi:hypothetical protein
MKTISQPKKSLRIEFPNDHQDFGTESKEYSRNFKIVERFLNTFFKQDSAAPLFYEVEQAVNEIDFLGKNHQLYLDSKDILRAIYFQNITTTLTETQIIADDFNSLLVKHNKFLLIGEQIFVNFEINYLLFKNYKNFNDFVYSLIKKIATTNRVGTLLLISEVINKLNALKVSTTDASISQLTESCSRNIDLRAWIDFLEKSGFYDDLIEEYIKISLSNWRIFIQPIEESLDNNFVDLVHSIYIQETTISDFYFPDSLQLVKERVSAFFIDNYLKSLLENFSHSANSHDYIKAKKILHFFDQASRIKVLKTHIVHFEKQRLTTCTSFQSVITFLSSFFEWTSALLVNFPELSAEVISEIQKFVNSDKEISPQLFSSSLDADINLNECRQTSTFLKLLDLLNNKDLILIEVFKYFCKAVLLDKNSQAYIFIFEELRKIYGEETVATFIAFLDQIEEGKEISRQIPSEMQSRIKTEVISSQTWPYKIESDATLLKYMPSQFAQVAYDLKKKYSDNNRLKELSFQTKHSFAEVECQIMNSHFTLVCNSKYLPLLMLFNKSTEWDIVMLATILKSSQENITKMVRKLHSQLGILNIDAGIVSLDTTRVHALSGKRIDLTRKQRVSSGLDEETIQKSFLDEEKKEDFIRRKEKQIKAYIVHRLKKDDKVAIGVLLDALKGELNLEILHSDISTMIDDLVNSELIKRNEADLNSLQYKK